MEEVENCLRVITNPREAGSGELSGALGRLDGILREAELDLHPRLKHFLENRSYAKALTWLEGGQPEKGTCGK